MNLLKDVQGCLIVEIGDGWVVVQEGRESGGPSAFNSDYATYSGPSKFSKGWGFLAGAKFVGKYPTRQDLEIEPFDPSKHKVNAGFSLPTVTNEEIQNFPEVLALKEQHKNLPVLVEGEYQCSRCEGKGKFVMTMRHCVRWLSGFKAEMSECWSCNGTGKKQDEREK